MKCNRVKGFTMFELLTVILILSIISLIGVAVQLNLDKQTKKAYYNSLEGTVTLAGRDYFYDHKDEMPFDTEYAAVIEINNRKTSKNLENKAYVTKVLDMNKNECPGKVLGYIDINNEYSYLACLECEDYKTTHRVCNCKEETVTDEETGEEYTTCKLDKIPIPTVTTVYKDNPNEVYKSYGKDGETFTYNDAIWTNRSIQVTYTTTYQYAKKIVVINTETDKIVDELSCNLTGNSNKTCSKNLNNTLYGSFKAYIVDDLNRGSLEEGKDFYIKIDKTEPKLKIDAYDTSGKKYTYSSSKSSSNNINLILDVQPLVAPSGYTYKWYYSTNLTSGSNKVLIAEVKLDQSGKFIPIKPTTLTDEIKNVDTSNGTIRYLLDENDLSLYISTPYNSLVKRKYMIEVTTGAGTISNAEQNVSIDKVVYTPPPVVEPTPESPKPVEPEKPKGTCTITASTSSGAYQGGWTNKTVTLTCNINNPLFSVKKWKKTSNGVTTEIQSTSNTYSVSSSVGSSDGDVYSAVIGLADGTGLTESAGFLVKVDKTNPKCGDVSGDSKSWTNKSRTIKVKCNDALSGCKESTYEKTYSSMTKTSSITIKDKAGNEKACSVNVYVDKTKPTVSISCSSCSGSGTGRTCTCTVSASDSHSGVDYRKYAVGYSCSSYSTYTKGYTFYPDKYVTCAYAVDNAGNKSNVASK